VGLTGHRQVDQQGCVFIPVQHDRLTIQLQPRWTEGEKL
jgi:hypothetical protein